MKQHMKRALVAGVITAAFGLGSALPASAHILVVDNNGKGGPKAPVWVGGGGDGGVPGRGQGLVPGGPGGTWMLPPSHAKGLVSACIAIRYTAEGKPAADIFGPPPGPDATCRHGGAPDFPDGDDGGHEGEH